MKFIGKCIGGIVSIGILVTLCSCQSGLEYSDLDLSSFDTVEGGQRLPFVTIKGNQLAFYVAPKGGGGLPDPLIILFPGIDSRALDRMDWVQHCPEPKAGFLLIDYPGRGRCEGVLRPSRLSSTTDGALNALAEFLSVEQRTLEKNVRVAGHSFGCGAALQFAVQTKVRSIVLLAPFTTMKKALFRKMGPLAWLIPDNLDNRKNLRRVLAGESAPDITIIHGVNDSTIPFAMGQELMQISPDQIMFIRVDEGSHVSILTSHRGEMYKNLLKE